MDSDPSHGTQVSEPAPGDSIRDSVAFFVRYLELRLQLFGLESRETGLHLLVLALLLGSTVICFVGFVGMLIVFLLYLMMLTLHWEWGWSAGTCRGAFCCQYWGRGDLQIQDREAVFPCHLRRVSEGS
ncbi:MAG: hypothetical protein WB586_01040 [Chthoniobacterales bacterium]